MVRVFSGIQPTGDLHMGNYLGAIRNWVAEQEEHDAVYCVVDLHAMTVEYDPAELAELTLRMVAGLVAAGIDPKRCTLFVQSHVPEHAELTWLLNCVATFGELQRMTQFKEKSEGKESVSAGLFDYPVLMAADILLYDTDLVPVGDDQRQHLELARDVAQRFNHRFGETFVVPEAVVPEIGARVMDFQAPDTKMSASAASHQGVVFLADPPDVVARKIKSAVTDSGTEVRYDPGRKPGVSNLLEIMAAVTGRPIPDLEAEYAADGYASFKSAVAETVVELLAPIRQRHTELQADPGELTDIVRTGVAKAREIAGKVLERARQAVGLLPA